MTTCEQWFWVSPLKDPDTGDPFIRELTRFTAGTEVTKGIVNRYAPKVIINRRTTPFKAGATTTSRRHDIRTLPFPIGAKGANITALQTLLADISREMSATLGMGILRYVGVDGRVRDLYCVQTAPLDTTAWLGSDGVAGQMATLQFEADDPYFHGDVNDDGFGGSAPGSWYPGIPWALGGSSIIGDETVTSHSDVEVFPEWRINGPSGGDVTATVEHTDVYGNPITETWHLVSPPFATGETVVIDTAAKTVLGPDGSNWFDYLTAYNLWPFVPGNNDISLSMSGATGASSITYSYVDLLLAP